MKLSFKYIIGAFLLLQVLACVEAIEIEPEGYENLLIVDATITDEAKKQEVSLNRTLPLYQEEDDDSEEAEESPIPVAETGAQVSLSGNDGSNYTFSENEPGKYFSDEIFKAEEGVNYQLEIETTDGEIYRSQETTLALSSSIDNIEAQRTSFRDEDGVALTVDNLNQEESGSNFYKYEYEETYKIVSKYTSHYDLEYLGNGVFREVRKTREERVCYNTRFSTDIILANTTSLSENRVEDLLIRFIPKGDPVLGRRYSILLKQIALSRNAYFYYSTLNELSGSDNLFSQNQPGFVVGNLYNETDPTEKVIGFFNVSSVSTQRIFINYQDFYDLDEEIRPYFATNCNPSEPSIGPPPPMADNLGELLEMGFVKYLEQVLPSPCIAGGCYRVIEAPCVDCNYFGTNVKPDFWEDED